MKRIYVKVNPRSSKNSVEQVSGGEFKVRITAPPIDNQANIMLIRVLADFLNVPRSSLKIIAGKTASIKIIDIIE